MEGFYWLVKEDPPPYLATSRSKKGDSILLKTSLARR